MRLLARINVTPVKGTALQHPETVTVTPAGIENDRRFYLVDDRGELYSGSTFGPLVRISSSYDPSEERLSLRFPDGTEVTGPADALGEAATTNFYGRRVAARAVEGPFRDAVAAYCGADVRLLRCDEGDGGIDVEPLTLVSGASVRDLAERGRRGDDLDPRRFRINLELEGCDPYEEDSWDGQRRAGRRGHDPRRRADPAVRGHHPGSGHGREGLGHPDPDREVPPAHPRQRSAVRRLRAGRDTGHDPGRRP